MRRSCSDSLLTASQSDGVFGSDRRMVTVFGGTGFLGGRVVRHLRKHEFFVRIASRHPDRGRRLFGLDDPKLQSIEANIHDERSVADAVAGAYGVVNAVSLYVEHGQETFHSVHVECAKRVAAQAHRAGVERFAHISGIGAHAASCPSRKSYPRIAMVQSGKNWRGDDRSAPLDSSP
jgi:uncharacterized protein YbjT (DUF2867 family)